MTHDKMPSSDDNPREASSQSQTPHYNTTVTAVTNDNSLNATQALMKKIRVSKAKAEIEQILSGPDAPIDLASELSRVVSMAPPLTDATEPSQIIAKLERDLYASVKTQNYEAAANVKQKLDQAHIDDCGAVLQVNAAFYRAFSKRDFASMRNVWTEDNTIMCIHPGSKAPLVGAKQVLQNWQALLEQQPAGTAFQSTWIEPRDIRLTVKGKSWAIVTCEEWVYLRRFRRGKPKETKLVNKCLATNVFRKVVGSDNGDNPIVGDTTATAGSSDGGTWKLTHHHSTFHANSPMYRNIRSDGDDAAATMDGILGRSSLTADLQGKFSRLDTNRNAPTPKVIVGKSLSDLLNGGLGDILPPPLGGSDTGDGASMGAIIRFQRPMDDSLGDDDEVHYLEIDEEVEDEDDDYDEEEDSESLDVVDHSHGRRRSVDWASSRHNNNNRPTKGAVKSPSNGKDILRQNCIQMLQTFAKEGVLSPLQKRSLITDIIYCSANGEYSTVEVAYELLCAESAPDDDMAEEEFAEQCRVLAASLVRPDSGTR